MNGVRPGRLINVINLDVLDGEIQTVCSIINPERLSHLGTLSPLGLRGDGDGDGDEGDKDEDAW